MAAEIAGCVIPPSRSSTIWMRSRCVDGSFHRSAVLSRRTSALLHLTIRSSRIRWLQRITPQIPKTTPPASPVINTPIHAVLEPVLDCRCRCTCSRVIHQRIGDVLRDQGKLDEAVKEYREDAAITGRLAAADSKGHPMA